MFNAYRERFLGQTLTRGDIAFMDNCRGLCKAIICLDQIEPNAPDISQISGYGQLNGNALRLASSNIGRVESA
jgi:hypothetical protein